MKDPYIALNVPRGSDQAAIKKAYRRLAKELHPDRNPDDQAAELRFKEVTQAYELLSDPEKRTQFDRGAIDANGRPRRGFDFGGVGDGPFRGGAESIFEKAFGRAFGRGGDTRFTRGADFEELFKGARPSDPAAGRRHGLRGLDLRHRLEVDFVTAASGGKQRLQLAGGRVLDVDVPAGTEDGKVLRLKGQGQPSPHGGTAGDALVTLVVRPHPRFRRVGGDIHLELPISLPEAILGAKVTVPTIDGSVRITIPPDANTGRTLRLRGKGIVGAGEQRGDQYVRLVVVLPDPPDPELSAYLRGWSEDHDYDVRADLGGT